MGLMLALAALLAGGVALTARWGATTYQTWPSARADTSGTGQTSPQVPSVRAAALGYLRGLAVALVAGFWAGALVTGPAVRLIMRLLAATAGDGAQGGLTEAKEVVGNIDFGGTMALYLFGGILPGLLSGAVYVLVRRLLPAGRAGGFTFGVLHLLLAATRIDPLRPNNSDFHLVGPGWLAVAAFGVAVIVHGMAVAAIANRFSTSFPPGVTATASRRRAALPVVLPALLLIPGFLLLVPISAGLLIAVAAVRLAPGSLIPSPGLLRLGRVALGAIALALLPFTAMDLRDIVTA